jgi:hypothetical protein
LDWNLDIISERWERIVLSKETIYIIKEIKAKLIGEEEEKTIYEKSDDDPPTEVWEWCLVVPWWRIIF